MGKRTWRKRLALGVVGGVLAAAPRPSRGTPAALLVERFEGPDGLVTNEFAHWNRGRGTESPRWELTSGSLFRREGAGWTGEPDSSPVDSASSRGNNSAVFRMRSRRADFGDVSVSFSLLTRGLVATPSTPAVDWDGVHVWLRYQDETSLYYASVNRRDDTVVIKKKTPGGRSNGGTYHRLAGPVPLRVPYGDWQRVRATVRNVPGGSVRLELHVDGKLVLSAIDDGVGGPPLRRPGRVGVRGDNAEFRLAELAVEPLGEGERAAR